MLSDEHFSVDGTLIRAWASHKSFVAMDGTSPDKGSRKINPEVDFKGKRRSNETHASGSDPDALLATKSGKDGAIPTYMGHVLMDNRGKLALDTRVTRASGTARARRGHRHAGQPALKEAQELRADKNYDTAGFVAACRDINVMPHVARNTYEYSTKTGKRVKRDSAIDGRTTRHAGFAIRQTIRKVIERCLAMASSMERRSVMWQSQGQ